MAYILKKIGNVSNIPAYHFECDNNEDILEIPLAGVPMSSTCYVINEGTMYTLNSEREWVITMRGGTGGNGAANSDAVLYTEQELSEEQQMQARKNLGLHNKKMAAVDAIPEQQVTFNNGSARCSDVKDLCYDLGILQDYAKNSCQLVLEINGEKYECKAQYYYGLITEFDGPYSSDGYSIYLSEGATVQNGDTATVHMYAIVEVIEKISDEYLSETIPKLTTGKYNDIVVVNENTYFNETPVPKSFTTTDISSVLSNAGYKIIIDNDELPADSKEIDLYGLPEDGINNFVASGELNLLNTDDSTIFRFMANSMQSNGYPVAGEVLYDLHGINNECRFLIYGQKIKGDITNWLIHYRINDEKGFTILSDVLDYWRGDYLCGIHIYSDSLGKATISQDSSCKLFYW